jgi:2-oxoglutarate ferredoxin oxidoreductase subunit alpha
LIDVRTEFLDDADIVVVSFGITSRVTGPAIEAARERGVKVGHLRLIITWPFPITLIRQLSQRVKAFVVPELNMGQMVLEVERAVAGTTRVISVPHAGGTVHEPQEILEKILEAAQ